MLTTICSYTRTNTGVNHVSPRAGKYLCIMCIYMSIYVAILVCVFGLTKPSTTTKANTARNAQVQNLTSILVPKATRTRCKAQYIAKSHPRAEYGICRITLIRTYRNTWHFVHLMFSSVNEIDSNADQSDSRRNEY